MAGACHRRRRKPDRFGSAPGRPRRDRSASRIRPVAGTPDRFESAPGEPAGRRPTASGPGHRRRKTGQVWVRTPLRTEPPKPGICGGYVRSSGIRMMPRHRRTSSRTPGPSGRGSGCRPGPREAPRGAAWQERVESAPSCNSLIPKADEVLARHNRPPEAETALSSVAVPGPTRDPREKQGMPKLESRIHLLATLTACAVSTGGCAGPDGSGGEPGPEPGRRAEHLRAREPGQEELSSSCSAISAKFDGTFLTSNLGIYDQ